MRHILGSVVLIWLAASTAPADKADDYLYNKMATIEGTVIIINHPTLGRAPANGTYLLFQRADCKKCVIATRTDIDGRYSITVLQGSYRVIYREGQIEGDGVDALAPAQQRVVEATSPIKPTKFDIEVIIPENK